MKEYGIRSDPRHRVHGSEVLCQGKIVRVEREQVSLPHGYETAQEVVHLPPAVAIVPITVDDSGQRCVVLVEQFRNSVRGHMHEIPAGVVEEGEDYEDCARRELEEETGFRAGKIQHIASLLMIPGTSAHRLHFFLAEDLSPGTQNLDQAECLRVRSVELDPLVERLLKEAPGSTPIVDSKTHLGLLHCWMLLAHREKGAHP